MLTRGNPTRVLRASAVVHHWRFDGRPVCDCANTAVVRVHVHGVWAMLRAVGACAGAGGGYCRGDVGQRAGALVPGRALGRVLAAGLARIVATLARSSAQAAPASDTSHAVSRGEMASKRGSVLAPLAACCLLAPSCCCWRRGHCCATATRREQPLPLLHPPPPPSPAEAAATARPAATSLSRRQ